MASEEEILKFVSRKISVTKSWFQSRFRFAFVSFRSQNSNFSNLSDTINRLRTTLWRGVVRLSKIVVIWSMEERHEFRDN